MADLQTLSTVDQPIGIIRKINDNFSEVETRKVDHDGTKVLSTNDYTNADKTIVDNALLKTSQTLTNAEQIQARSNIGAGTGNGTVTSISAGSGMNFSTINTTGSITMGTPSSVGSGSTNSATAGTHTHAIALATTDIPDLSAKYLVTTQKGIAGGLATLDTNGKVPLSQMNDAILGQLLNGGTVNASTALATLSANGQTKLGTSSDTITLTNDTTAVTGYAANNGLYYIVETGGTFAGMSFITGDWLLSLGNQWSKIDNTDAVSSVNGKTGVVVLTAADVGALSSGTTYVTSVNGQSGVITGLATLANPQLTGTPTAPTASSTDNSTQIATTAFVKGLGYTSNTGTVTSIGITNGTNGGMTISGGPITSNGTISIAHSNILSSAQGTQAIYPIAIDKNGHISSYGTAIVPLTKENIIAGDNVTVTISGNNITIASTGGGSSTLSEVSWTATDSRWSTLTDGIYTLTIASTSTPVGYAKRNVDGVYTDCMASASSNGTNIYIKSDTKFAGKIAVYTTGV